MLGLDLGFSSHLVVELFLVVELQKANAWQRDAGVPATGETNINTAANGSNCSSLVPSSDCPTSVDPMTTGNRCSERPLCCAADAKNDCPTAVDHTGSHATELPSIANAM